MRTALELYEIRYELRPLSPEEVSDRVESAEQILISDVAPRDLVDERLICWLHDRLQAVYAAARKLKADFADALTRAKAFGDEVTELHARISDLEEKLASSESEVRALTSEVEDLRGRKIGRVDTWAEAASEATGMYDHMRKLHEAMKATIRSLLDTELPAGELRRALGELVR